MKQLLNKNFIGLLFVVGFIFIPIFKTEAASWGGDIYFTVNLDKSSYQQTIGGEVATVEVIVGNNSGFPTITANLSAVLSTSNILDGGKYSGRASLVTDLVVSDRETMRDIKTILLPSRVGVYMLYLSGSYTYYNDTLAKEVTEVINSEMKVIITPNLESDLETKVSRNLIEKNKSVVVEWESVGTVSCYLSYPCGNLRQTEAYRERVTSGSLQDQALDQEVETIDYQCNYNEQEQDQLPMDGFYLNNIEGVKKDNYGTIAPTYGRFAVSLAQSSHLVVKCIGIPFIQDLGARYIDFEQLLDNRSKETDYFKDPTEFLDTVPTSYVIDERDFEDFTQGTPEYDYYLGDFSLGDDMEIPEIDIEDIAPDWSYNESYDVDYARVDADLWDQMNTGMWTTEEEWQAAYDAWEYQDTAEYGDQYN